MRYSVLRAGTALRKTQQRCGDYGQMFVDLFSEPGQRWEVHDVENGDLPVRVNDYDGFVITGSRFSAYDDIAWIRRLQQFIRRIFQDEIPLIGICFGHQIIAQALGGEVRTNPRGWDVGLRKLVPTREAKRFPPWKNAKALPRILECHQDIVSRLPPGAVHLASSELTEFEMYRIGRSVLSIQGHPEFDNETVREIIAELHARKILSALQILRAKKSLWVEPDRSFFRDMLQTVLFSSGSAGN